MHRLQVGVLGLSNIIKVFYNNLWRIFQTWECTFLLQTRCYFTVLLLAGLCGMQVAVLGLQNIIKSFYNNLGRIFQAWIAWVFVAIVQLGWNLRWRTKLAEFAVRKRYAKKRVRTTILRTRDLVGR